MCFCHLDEYVLVKEVVFRVALLLTVYYKDNYIMI